MGKRGYWTKEQNKSKMTQKAALRSLRGNFAVTSQSLRGPKWPKKRLRDHFAVTSRLRRSHFAVINDSKSGFAITSLSLRGYDAVTSRS